MVRDDSGEPYRGDLAYVHDVGFGGFAEAVAPRLVRILREAGIVRGRVVDLGCGPGHLARHLLDAGYDVTGVDVSAAMIDRARERAPEADLRVGSALDVDLPPCGAVIALGEVLNYCFDERLAAGGLPDLFRRVFDGLEPGGLFVFDVARAAPPGPPQAHSQGDDWAVLVDREIDPRGRLVRHITTFRRAGDGWRRDREVHAQRLHDPAALAEALRGVGFRVRVRRGYGDLVLAPTHAVLMARRPSA